MMINIEFLVLIAVIVILLLIKNAPLENKNHLLYECEKKRNKKILLRIILFDLVLLILFCFLCKMIAIYEMVFIILNGVLFMIGKVEKMYIDNAEIC